MPYFIHCMMQAIVRLNSWGFMIIKLTLMLDSRQVMMMVVLSVILLTASR